MAALKKPPRAYAQFVRRFPELGRAWTMASSAGGEGPLDENMRLVVKLALAVGAQRESAVHSAARKALAGGVALEAMEQVTVLGASMLGFPAAVAAYGWIQDEVAPKRPKRPRSKSRR